MLIEMLIMDILGVGWILVYLAMCILMACVLVNLEGKK